MTRKAAPFPRCELEAWIAIEIAGKYHHRDSLQHCCGRQSHAGVICKAKLKFRPATRPHGVLD